MSDLITLYDYKEAESISNPKDDVKLSALITSVSQLVKTYCGKSFLDYYSTPKMETFVVEAHTHSIQLVESPVVEIVSVQERDAILEPYITLSAANGDFYFDASTDTLIRSDGGMHYKYWSKGLGAVKVSYRAGYEETPADLKLAVIDLVTYYHKDEHKQSKSMSGANIQNPMGVNADNFPAHIRRILELYRG
jgi:hypothetical protein